MTRRPIRARSPRRDRTNPYRRPDAHSLSARAAGYAARSVHKLAEIDRRVRLLRQGHKVLDLGAAPGSWSQYVAEKIGREGKLLAVDPRPIAVDLPAWCEKMQGDALLLGPDLGRFAPYDVVLSDMAPSTTGDKATDQIRSFELCCGALAVASTLLVTGGKLVVKIFMGRQFPEARTRMRAAFETVRVIRPEAVRSVSYEVFLVGLGRRSEAA